METVIAVSQKNYFDKAISLVRSSKRKVEENISDLETDTELSILKFKFVIFSLINFDR